MKKVRGKSYFRSMIAASAALAVLILSLCWPGPPAGASGGEPPLPKAKYTEFPHSAKAHKMECSKCHSFPSDNWKTARPEKEAFPDVTEYPKHQSCLNCHKQQFFKGSPPKICSICHVNPSPKDSTRHPFPNPREVFDLSPKGKTAESDFVVAFPHDKHVDIVSQQPTTVTFVNAGFIRTVTRPFGEESCSVCHKTMKPQGDSKDEYATPAPAKLGDGFWLKKGTFKSKPLGHTVCATCHSADSGMLPAPSDCATCHKLKPDMPNADFDAKLAGTMKIDDKVMTDAWKLRDSSGKFQHEFFAHVDLPCSTCHNVTTLKLTEPSTMKVAISNCATCHATATTDDGGAINYEIDSRAKNPKFECVKCHTAFGKLAIPESHTKAVAAASGK